MEVGIDCRDREDAFVDPLLRRDVAPARRDQQKQRDARPDTTITPGDDRVPDEAFSPVCIRRTVFKLRQNAGETLMRFGKIRIDAKRRLEVQPRTRDIAILEQQIGQTNAPDRITRMIMHRLSIGGTRG